MSSWGRSILNRKTDLSDEFLHWWGILAKDAPGPVREYRFCPGRRFRFDLAWPRPTGGGVACELEGGEWVRGRHQRPRGFARDCEKYTAAAVAGWAVLRFTGAQFRADPAGCVALVRRALQLPVAGWERRT